MSHSALCEVLRHENSKFEFSATKPLKLIFIFKLYSFRENPKLETILYMMLLFIEVRAIKITLAKP